MLDFTNVTAIALGADDVLEIQDSLGTVLWQKTIYYNVNISAGSNGTVSVNGVSGDYSQSVPSGTVLTIEGTGNTGYDFDEWSDGNTDNPRTITVTGDLTLTASFESAALPNYFYVEDISGTDNTLSVTKSREDVPTIEVFKSTDGTNWESMGSTSTTAITATVPANGKLYLKATANAWGTGWDGNKITCSSNYNVGGNIMSLLNGDNFENTSFIGTSREFQGLFRGSSTLVNAKNVVFPNNIAYASYRSMFSGCTSLISVSAYSTSYDSISFNGWLDGVSATGTFYNMACTTYPSGNSGIPAGWTELHTLNDTINVTITNTGNYTGATYQIDSGTAQPINETGTTSFTVPVTATTLTIHRNGKGVTDVHGICGYSEDSDWDAAFPVGKMTDNVSIDIMSLM